MKSEIKREAWLVFLVLFFMFAYFYHDPWWNGNSRLGLTLAIVQEGRLEIDSFQGHGSFKTGDKSYFNGHYYTDKAIGSSLVAAAFYFPIYHAAQALGITLGGDELKYPLTLLTIGLPSALACTLMYILCRQAGGSRFRAYVATLAVSLGTMIFPCSITFFGHQLAGSALFAAFFLIYQLKLASGSPKKGILFLTGFLLGFALITEYTVTPIVLILAVYYIYILSTKGLARSAAGYILPVLGGLIPITLLLAYNTAVYGSPFSIGYAYMSDPGFQEAHSQGIIGVSWPKLKVLYYLTLHPAMGLFWQSPVLLLSLAGLWIMGRIREFRAEALVGFTAFLSLLLVNSGHYMWWGGDTFGPRHLIPMLPFLSLPLIFIPRRWFSGVVILGIISIVQMIIVAASQLFFVPEYYLGNIGKSAYFAFSSIYSYCLKQLLVGDFSINLGTKILGLQGWNILIPPFLILTTGTLVMLFGLRYIQKSTSLDKRVSIQG